MLHLFRVDASHIKLLNDEQARELVARLCKAECQRLGHPESSVIWGGDQRAPDGGVDVSVDLVDAGQGLDFIPRGSTVFQVKAEPFPPSKIGDEVAPRGTVRDFFSKLSSLNGAYVIVSTQDDCSQLALNARRDKIAEVLSNSAYRETVHIDFYCARRLADWVEKYPRVIVWLRDAIKLPMTGWRGYGPWAYQESDVDAEYIIDDQVRVRVPEGRERVDVTEAIRHVRRQLHTTCSIRIVGLSGVGKTRFVQAIFDERLVDEVSSPSKNNVVYCDLGDEVLPSPQRMIEDLLARNDDAVIVVDNCNPAEHSRLAHAIGRSGSQLKLITIEYDIRDDLPEKTSVYALEGASSDTIVRLLRRRCNLLSSSDAYRIAEYSDGNARVAFALASTAESTGDFVTLKDADLFDRLFRQKKPEDAGLLQSAEVASLLFSFDFETSGPGSEADLLAALADTTPATFRRHMLELQERGILQKRGVWRAVLPHAIANKLASKALVYLDLLLVKKVLFDDASDRVSKSLTKRLNFLHFSSQAASIATLILEDGGPAGWPRRREPHVKDIFRNLAPLSPSLAIKRLAEAQRDDSFMDSWFHTRQQYIEIAAGLAYEEANFEDAFALLVEFAVSKKHEKEAEVAAKAIDQLSQIYHSGTLAPARLRQSQVVNLLSSEDAAKEVLGFRALAAALKTANFHSGRVSGLAHRPRSFGWQPGNETQSLEWYIGWLGVLAEHLSSERARLVLAEAIRGLWGLGGLRSHLRNLTENAFAIDGWPEGWLAYRHIMKWDRKRLSHAELSEVSDLANRIAPQTLEKRIKAFVFGKGTVGDVWTDPDDTADEDLTSWDRLMKKVEDLGREAAMHPDVIRAMLPEMMRKGGQNAYAFGRALGQGLEEIDWLLADIEKFASATGVKMLSLVVFRGLLYGHSERNLTAVEAFLARAMGDKVWAGRLIELQTSVPPSPAGWARLFEAIRLGNDELSNLRWLMQQPAYTADTIGIYEDFIDALVASGPDGVWHAWQILGHVFRDDDSDKRTALNQLLRPLTDLILSTDWQDYQRRGDLKEYYVTAVLKATAEHAPSSAVQYMLSAILKSQPENDGYISRDQLRYASIFFQNHTVEVLDAFWEAAGNKSRSSLRHSIDDSKGLRRSSNHQMSTDQVIEWCNRSPIERYAFASEICDLFERDETIGRLVVTELALTILANAPNKQEVIQSYIERFRPSAWSGPLSEILETRLHLFSDLRGDPSLDKVITEAESEFRDELMEQRRIDLASAKAEAQSFE